MEEALDLSFDRLLMMMMMMMMTLALRCCKGWLNTGANVQTGHCCNLVVQRVSSCCGETDHFIPDVLK